MDRALRIFALFFLSIFSLSVWSQANQVVAETTSNLLRAKTVLATKKLSAHEQEKLLALAKKRRDLILQHMSSGKFPQALMGYLLSQKMVEQFPKTIQPYLEQEIQLQGILEIRSAIAKNGQEYFQYVVRKKSQEYYLYFVGNIPEHLQTGQLIKISQAFQFSTGKEIFQIIVPNQNFQIVKNTVQAVPEAFGAQNLIVIPVTFQDKPNEKPWTVEQIAASFNTAVNAHIAESSYGQTTVHAKVTDWYPIAASSTEECNALVPKISSLASQAAANAGIDLTPYKRRVYVFIDLPQCAWAGLGTVGIPPGKYSEMWLDGRITLKVEAHELGHNFGLSHAQQLLCPNSVEEGTCTRLAYGDHTDIMGDAESAYYSAYAKDRLGWLNYQNSPPITTVTTSGTYNIDVYEIKNNNPKALKVLKQTLANGSKDYYYLEYRQPIGGDAPLNCNGCDFTRGVIFHTGNDKDGNTSNSLDMSPGDNNTYKKTLLPGNSYSNPNAANGGVTFTVNSVTAASASVKVQFGATPPPPVVCEHQAQTMTITPVTTQWIPAGGSANYTITVKNNDTSKCSASNFYINTSVLNDSFKATLDTQWLSLAPQETKSVNLTVATTTGLASGLYAVGVTTNNTVTNILTSVIANVGINP